jgi:pilus assembly protein CpaB
MRVDVVINGSSPLGDAGQGTQARTLLQNIEVLSAGQDFKKDAEGKPVTSQVVNLLVTPEQAEKLSLAAGQTTVQLVLRNPLDRQIAPTPGTDLAALYGPSGARPPAPAPAAPPAPKPADTRPVVHEAPPQPVAFTMEIISGSQKTEKQFVNQGGTR